jgi:hypothetical protein
VEVLLATIDPINSLGCLASSRKLSLSIQNTRASDEHGGEKVDEFDRDLHRGNSKLIEWTLL